LVIEPMAARRDIRTGFDDVPRVRPRLDRWCLDEGQVLDSRARGRVPLGHVGGSGPVVLVTMDRGDGPRGPEARIGVDYVDAVLDAGCTPWLVPPGERHLDGLFAEADGLVITGGAFDIHPHHYGQTVLGRLDRVEEDRTLLELALATRAMASGVPTLGICGGLQVLAVAAGGTLVQDLPTSPTHEQPTDPAEPWHDVALTGRLAAVLGTATAVNSTHHQAVADPGSLTVCGRSPDGVVEAVEHDTAFVFGVQWHPERLGDLRLYEALADAARRGR
jgi:putative glutamine amidotransferase